MRFIEGLGDRGLVDFFFMESHKKNMYFLFMWGYNLCFEMIVPFKKVIHASKSNTHTLKEDVWLGGVMVFFKDIYFKHKPYLTMLLKTIKTYFLLKKKNINHLPFKNPLKIFGESPFFHDKN